MKILDTFAGIGGFSYAAEKLIGGFETTQFIEIDPFCQKVLKKHWPHVPIHDDIRTFTAKPREYQVITGGFPCQDISVAGLQKGITEKTRSGLFFELMRVIRMVRPEYVVLENVAAILNRGLDIVLRELSEAGYDAEWSVISASSVGACHQRSRWWLIAYPNHYGSSSTEKCELNGEASDRTQKGQNQSCQSERSSKPSSSRAIQSSTESPNTFSQRTQIQYEQRGSSIWNLPSSYGKKGSTLSPNWQAYESKPCLRRGDDGLSDWTHRLKALGNSIVPQVAAIPLQRVKDLYATAS